jgi:energy-coupling factor transporter transmembrane protein EcfT
MRDPRLKILAVIALSIASFTSTIAALLTVTWWLFHDRERGKIFRSRPFWIYLGIIALFSLLVQIEEGNGISYLIRLGSIAVVALWTFREYRCGEFLDVSVWAFGKKTGFELGLVAEMSMQGFRVLGEDMDRIRMAHLLKGQRWSGKVLPSALSLLLITMLRRADKQAQLLALRGYQKGGELCPEFPKPSWDVLSTIAALLILAFSVYLTSFPA